MVTVERSPQAPVKIQTRGLVKTFSHNGIRVEVLTGVDLDIFKGETLAVVGASGVGKSTLLHIMGTLERPSAGRMLWDGEDVFSLDDKSLAAFRNRHWATSLPIQRKEVNAREPDTMTIAEVIRARFSARSRRSCRITLASDAWSSCRGWNPDGSSRKRARLSLEASW